MEERAQAEDVHWDSVMESLDLLFAKIGVVENRQQRMETQFDVSARVMEQILVDQQTLAKQMESTGNAVAQLTMNQMRSRQDRPPSPASSDSTDEMAFQQRQQQPAGGPGSVQGRSGAPPPHRSFHRDRGGTGEHNSPRTFVPKMQFPTFTGPNPGIWKDKCEDYFRIFNLPESMWPTYASLHMHDKAAKWLKVYKLKNGLGDWSSFIAAVEQKFGSNDYRDSLNQLLELQQLATVDQYISTFEDLQYQLTMHNSELGEMFFITQFLRGLKPEIGNVVQSQIPETMERAMLLARIQQQVVDKGKRTKPVTNYRQATTPPKYDTKTTTPTSLLWKERQTRDYLKANGLCFYCREPYDANHAKSCTKRPQQQLNALTLNGLDAVLTEEVIQQLELEDNLTSEFCQLSLNALAGTAQGEALVVRALVHNKVMLILVDSGSSHSFISQSFHSFVQMLNIPTVPMAPQQVKLANGDTLTTNQWVPSLEWWSNGYTVQTNMKVLQIPAYDAILGYDWLKANSPMQCNWAEKTLEFQHKGQPVILQGICPSLAAIPEVSVQQVRKWIHGNDVWALAVVEETPMDQAKNQDQTVQELLQQYQDVFQEPQHLPPHRFYDHHIPLLPGSAPVNARPYKYSPHHKDEIERQVKQLLAAGLITQSCSPFASPVLLVLKKDGSWRFCVDYRKLNDLTIKNRFPMPLIEEILDELAGTKYFTKLDMRSGYHQVRMKPEDEYKTAFKTHQGHYQFKVMPFGLTNAPATFQCIMN